MKNILIRAGKVPYHPLDAETTLARNTLGTNSGNLLFAQSVFRGLSTEGTTITANEFKVQVAKVDEINEKYDGFVVPMASAFRTSFAKQLILHAEFIEKLKIPAVVVGIGAQAPLDCGPAWLKPIEAEVKRFVSAVLDKSASIGVRGEFTAEYLHSLGFSAVDVIGCPSMFMHGPNLHIEKKIARLDETSRVSINISPYIQQMGPVLALNQAQYPRLVYIPQDELTLKHMLWGEPDETRNVQDPNPIHLSHSLFVQDRVRFFIDARTWFSFLSEFHFAFGTRIHGNVAAILAGIPCFLIAHDSRTLELAAYFHIPHRTLPDLRPAIDAAELYAEADFGPLNRGHRSRFDRYTAFLEKNGLKHVFAPGQNSHAFDDALARAALAPAVQAPAHTRSSVLADRIRWLHTTHEQEITDLTRRIRALEHLVQQPPSPHQT